MAFTEENKKTIDMLSAIAAFAATALYFYRKKSDLKTTGAYSLAAGILAYIAVSSITKTMLDSANQPDDVDSGSDPSLADDWDPKPTTDRLHEELNRSYWDQFTSSNDLDAYSNALNLSNDGLAKVYNDWTDRYWAEDNETLTARAANHTIYWGLSNGSDADALRDQLVSRLQYLGFN